MVYEKNINERLKSINVSFGRNSAYYDLNVDPHGPAARVIFSEYALQ